MKMIQSSTHHCFVCGIDNPFGLKMQFNSDGDGQVSSRIIFPAMYQGYPGIVHGGILAAVLDETAGRATMKHKRPDLNLVTGKMTIRYRKPVKVEEEVSIEGKVLNRTGRVFICSSSISSLSGELLAEAEVTLVEPGSELLASIMTHEDQWVDHE